MSKDVTEKLCLNGYSHAYTKLTDTTIFCTGCGDIKKVPKDCPTYPYPMWWQVSCPRCNRFACECNKYTWWSPPYTTTITCNSNSDNVLYSTVSPN